MAKESSKTNKTAHVLNLLTDTETVPEASENGKSQSKDSPAAAERADDSQVEQQIRNALERDLLADQGEKQPVPAPEVPAEPQPAPAPEIPAEPQPAPAPGVPAKPQPAPAPEAPNKPVSKEALVPPSLTKPSALSGISYINVMQALVEEKVDKYIKLFGLCTCPRCKIDVMALALTNLPAKYVVTRENEAIPMLSVYEGRYNAAVISQVMWACKTVMDNPRHNL